MQEPHHTRWVVVALTLSTVAQRDVVGSIVVKYWKLVRPLADVEDRCYVYSEQRKHRKPDGAVAVIANDTGVWRMKTWGDRKPERLLAEKVDHLSCGVARIVVSIGCRLHFWRAYSDDICRAVDVGELIVDVGCRHYGFCVTTQAADGTRDLRQMSPSGRLISLSPEVVFPDSYGFINPSRVIDTAKDAEQRRILADWSRRFNCADLIKLYGIFFSDHRELTLHREERIVSVGGNFKHTVIVTTCGVYLVAVAFTDKHADRFPRLRKVFEY